MLLVPLMVTLTKLARMSLRYRLRRGARSELCEFPKRAAVEWDIVRDFTIHHLADRRDRSIQQRHRCGLYSDLLLSRADFEHRVDGGPLSHLDLDIGLDVRFEAAERDADFVVRHSEVGDHPLAVAIGLGGASEIGAEVFHFDSGPGNHGAAGVLNSATQRGHGNLCEGMLGADAEAQ